MFTLRLIFIIQLLVMLTGFGVFLTTPADFQTAALLVYLVAIGVAVAAYAAWQFVKHPDRRKVASATVATPVLLLTSPFLIKTLHGSPLSPAALTALIALVCVVTAFLSLSKPSRWHAEGTFADRSFNLKFVALLAALLVLFWAPIVTWLATQDVVDIPKDIESRDKLLRLILFYFVSIAGPAFLLSLCALIYAPIGLIRNKGIRLIHLGQLVIALFIGASLAVGAVIVFIGLLNPG